MSDFSTYRETRTRHKKKHLQKRRRRVILWVAAILLVIAGLIAVAGTIIGWDINNLPFMKKSEKKPSVNQPATRATALIIGVKETEAGEEAEALMLATYNPTTKKLDVVSIPKNTMVEITGRGSGEIRQAYSMGKISLVKSSVEYLMSVKIDHYFKVSETGLREIIDALGGVTLAGTKTDGEGVLDYLNQKAKDEKEEARINRQNDFIKALQKKTGKASIFAKLDATIDSLKSAYDTDFSPSELKVIIPAVAALKADAVRVQTLPVKEVAVDQKTFSQPEKTAIAAMITRIFGGKAVKSKNVRVRVLNGAGEPGVASDLANKLTDNGYRVVDSKNADNFNYTETQILIYSNKSSEVAKAEELKKIIGVGKIVVNNLPQDVADITVIIGKDYIDLVKEYVLQKKIEVLNGSGRNGLAAEMAEKLKAAGYDIVNTGNADRSDYAKTVITVYVDKPQVKTMANDVKTLLGAGEVKVSSEPRTDIEISITLGKDL